MSSTLTYILIGGYAAAHAARAIRERDSKGRIVLVNAEEWAPYERPPLSKDLLYNEDYKAENTFTESDKFYGGHNIELRLNTRAISIDRGKREVELDDGSTLNYDKLLLAPGSGAKKPEFEGGDFSNIRVIRTLGDSLTLRDELKRVENVAIVGGSYLGLEVASGALKVGANPTVIDSNDGPWSKFASPELQSFLIGEFKKAGAKFVWNQQVKTLVGDEKGKAIAVQTDEGTIETDLVVAAIGATLQTELAKDAELEIDKKHGIIVDATLRTDDPNIWVAGDCAAYPEAFVGTLWHNEHYRNAQWQGEIAGANMASAYNNAQNFARAPYFFSDVLDLHMILRGNPAGGKPVKVLGAMKTGEFAELYADDEGIVAMVVMISHDKSKTRAVADKLEPWLWEKKQLEEYSAEMLDL